MSKIILAKKLHLHTFKRRLEDHIDTLYLNLLEIMNKPLGKLIVYNGGPQEYLINQEVKPFIQEKVINDILNSHPQGVLWEYEEL